MAEHWRNLTDNEKQVATMAAMLLPMVNKEARLYRAEKTYSELIAQSVRHAEHIIDEIVSGKGRDRILPKEDE